MARSIGDLVIEISHLESEITKSTPLAWRAKRIAASTPDDEDNHDHSDDLGEQD
jgi:hypothetical protein